MPRFWIFGRSNDVCTVNSAEKIDNVKLIEVDKCLSPVSKENDKLGSGNSIQLNSTSVIEVNDSPPLYYAVSLPFACEGEVQNPLVYLDKKEALKAVKKYEGARFKAFQKQEDAVAFASQSVEVACATPKADFSFSPPVFEPEKAWGAIGEKPSQFRAPKSQDLVKLRKAIVAGDIDYFKETVWSNPRYLISSGDTPSILKEGFRYNALHVAAKHKQPEICQLVIDTIENPAFMEHLYWDDTELVRNQRIAYIIDLYLNMPDKGLCETPLHFAAKIGCLKAVQILASHPACDKERRNKYGLLAREIICERCPSSSIELKQQIEEAFEKQYFVPVLRSEDNSIQPTIGKPCSKEGVKETHLSNSDSPCSTVLTVMAVAGPMSPKQADVFYKHLKTPPARFSRSQYKELNRIRLCDTEKGLERIGRDLARSMRAQWTEFWPSLNTWCDLSSPEGLEILENHLRKQYHEICSRMSFTEDGSKENVFDEMESPCTKTGGNLQLVHSTPAGSPSSKSDDSSGISKLCSGLNNFHMYDQAHGDIVTSPDMPSLLKAEHDEGLCLYDMQSSSGSSSLKDGVHEFHSLGDSPKATRHSVKKELNFVNGSCGENCHMSNETSYSSSTHLKRNEVCNMKEMSRADSCVFNEKHQNISAENLNSNQDFVNSPFNNESKTCARELFGRSNTHCFLPSINNLILCILEMFYNLVFNSEMTNEKEVHELAEDVLPKIKCLLKSCKDIKQDLSEVHSFVAQEIFKKTIRQFLKHETGMIHRLLISYLGQYSSVYLCKEVATFKSDITWKHLKCILESFCALCSNNATELQPCHCIWVLPPLKNTEFKFFYQRSSRSCNNVYFDGHQDACMEFEVQDSDCNFYTPPTSPKTSASSSDEELGTPDEGLEVYVEGEYPSKADIDILRAIEDVPLDPVLYPHVCRWKHLVECKDKKTVESWPSPAMKQLKQEKRFSEFLSCSPISPLAINCDTPRKCNAPAFIKRRELRNF